MYILEKDIPYIVEKIQLYYAVWKSSYRTENLRVTQIENRNIFHFPVVA